MNAYLVSLLRLVAIWASASALLVAQTPSHLSSDDDNWDSRFGVTIDGEVYAVASGGGNIYIGGSFTRVGGVPAANIARWNGSEWQALGSGIDGTVYALALAESGTLYAGGDFFTAGPTTASHVAMWNGSTWSGLAGGLDGTIFSLATRGSLLYAGGSFVTVAADTLSSIACWNGTSWSALGKGFPTVPRFPAIVYALAVDGGDIYAGGRFFIAGNDSVWNIARWDGASWHPMDSGFNKPVTALAVTGGDLFAGGSFSQSGSTVLASLARWDRGMGKWRSAGNRFCCSVNALASYGPELIVAGEFTETGTDSVRNVTTLNTGDGSWHSVGGGVDGIVQAVAADGNGIYAGGAFYSTGGKNIARWNGGRWVSIGNAPANGLNGDIRTLVQSGSDLYAGGIFSYAGSEKASAIARWDGSEWHQIGGGIDGQVEAIVPDGDTLYVGGRFGRAADVNAVDIVRWDGTKWSPLASNSTGRIYSLALSGDDLYVGGAFTSLDTISINAIARLHRSTGVWSVLDSGLRGGAFPTAFAIAVMGSDIYVGGTFDSAGGIAASNIARWDGSQWHAVGAGVNGPVHALALRNDTLYAGGEFTSAGDIPAPHIARWDGASWSTLGGGLDNDVGAIAIADGGLYAGGSFAEAGGNDALRIARWDIQRGIWSPLGSGITGGNNPTVKALAVRNNEVYVGGDFATAGNKPSLNIARWLAPILSVGEENGPGGYVNGNALRLGRSSPNPASSAAIIPFRLTRSSFSTLKIYDARGREVATLLSGEMAAGDHRICWPVDGVADGIYFYRLSSSGVMETGEMVVLH